MTMIIFFNLILFVYALSGLVILGLTILASSHKAMNYMSIALPASYLIITLFTLAFGALPSYSLGGNYFLIDHLSLYEILLAGILFLLAALYSRGYIEGSIEMREMNRSNLKLFYFAFNLLLMTITYAFLSDNLALFWILAELSTVLSAVLIVMLNAPKNIGAALKYIFITSTCMLFAFIGLILIFTMTTNNFDTGTLNWSTLMSIANSLSPGIMFAAFMFTFVGFAAKSGIVPFHAWLPSAHSKAPAPISAILSGCITSVGLYGIIRIYALVAQTSELPKISVFLICFGVLGMIVAALTMLNQVNLKKLIGYSTVENMGFILVAIGLGTPLAIFWMLFYKLAHAFTKASLFFSAGILHQQFESVRMERLKNVLKRQPFAAWSLILGTVAIMGLPLSAVFIPKFGILLESASLSPFLLLGLLSVFLVVASAFGIFLIKMLSQKETDSTDIPQYQSTVGMKIAIAALLIAVFILGVFFPQQLADLLNNIVFELGVR